MTMVHLKLEEGSIAVCEAARLTPGRGVAALLPDGRQVAVFSDRRGRTYAIDNRDPFTGAYVLSRGLLGSTPEGRPYVASPLLKHRFDLETGACLDDEAQTVRTYVTVQTHVPEHSRRPTTPPPGIPAGTVGV